MKGRTRGREQKATIKGLDNSLATRTQRLGFLG
jgi:hypothetical protein